MKPLLLEGEVDTRDQEIESLNNRIADLEGELEVARAEAKRAMQQGARAVAKLRQILGPLYNSLQVLFGEMDATGLVESDTSSAAPATDARWESWKKRLPGRPAEMIDLLLLHKSMSVKNLMAAMHCGKDSVYQAAYKLGQAGIVSNNGGRYELKA